MANWERKSSYLLREIVKFRTYIDCLQSAQAQKEVVRASRAPPSAPDPISIPVPAAGNSEGQEKENQQPDEKEEKCAPITSSTDATL